MSTELIAEENALTPPPARPSAPRRGLLARLVRHPVGLVCTIYLLLVVLFGLLAPLLAPFSPELARLELTNTTPFASDFVFGGDQAGRDILSRLMYATNGTLLACLVVLVVSAGLGVTTGLIAGYFGGIFEAIGDWIANVIMSLPGLVLLISLYTIIGPKTLVAMAFFGILIAPAYYRLVRNLVVNVRHELYVDAAKVAGLSDFRIVSRHILRAVRGPIVVQSSFVLSAGIGIQAALQFLGLGDPAKPSWGGILQGTFATVFIAGSNVVAPAVLISLTILALVMLGNVLRDLLGITARQQQPLRAKITARLRQEYAARTPAGVVTEESAEAPLLSVSALVIGYPTSPTSVVEVVHGVELTVNRGEIHGLVGESGSGKSQTAFSVVGILPHEAVILSGSVKFHGRELLGDDEAVKAVRGRRIAYVPQEPMSNLDPTFTIGQQLTFGLRAVKSISKAQAKKDLVALLTRVGIKNAEHAFDLYPHEISGGMAQRVLIAGAIAADPELLVADEPTTALDVTVQAEVLELLRELQRERNLGMILVTHNLGVVADICDTVSVMKDGLIVETGSVSQIFDAPQHQYTKMLLGSTLDGSKLREPLADRSGS